MDAKPLSGSAGVPGYEVRFLEAKGTRLRYFVGGDGPPLILVHGLGGAASNWRPLAPALAARRRVLIPDLPGHGGSSPLPVVANVNAFADRVALIAERERALPAPVVGHSFGGVVALRLACRRPNDVSAVVLISAAGISSTTRRARYALRITGLVQPGKRVSRYAGDIARSPILRTLAFMWWGAADPAALSPEAAEGFLAGPRLHTDVVSASRALVADDPRPELDRVACPALVIWGARDNQLPVEDAFEYARRLRAPLRVVADCGHLVIGERPAACLDAIDDLLGRLD